MRCRSSYCMGKVSASVADKGRRALSMAYGMAASGTCSWRRGGMMTLPRNVDSLWRRIASVRRLRNLVKKSCRNYIELDERIRHLLHLYTTHSFSKERREREKKKPQNTLSQRIRFFESKGKSIVRLSSSHSNLGSIVPNG